jgi:Trk K+ transport system NAD-binding subunit
LELAGCSHVLQLGEMMGQALARRAIGYDSRAHVIGQFGQLFIAEAAVKQTSLEGKTLQESRLREKTGINVVGIWQRGKFELARPETCLGRTTILVLAGSAEQLQGYNDLFGSYPVIDSPVVIIGGGRVGRAAGRALVEQGLDYRIVEQLPERIRDPNKYVLGNAAELEVLEQAGIMATSIAIVTTHNDDTNIYLTLYCRRLRPDIQIISRATLERNVATLHRAGADFVMSYATMGSNAIMNLLSGSDILMIAEGLNIFRLKTPPDLVGKTIAETSIRRETGCHIIALQYQDRMVINPDPALALPAEAELILVGTVEAEDQFLKEYSIDPDLTLA